MGHIHETDDPILCVETDHDAFVLGANQSDGEHLRARCLFNPDHTRQKIADTLRERAGEHFKNDKDDQARMWRDMARFVEQIDVSVEQSTSVVISGEYMRALYDFLAEHPETMERKG